VVPLGGERGSPGGGNVVPLGGERGSPYPLVKPSSEPPVEPKPPTPLPETEAKRNGKAKKLKAPDDETLLAMLPASGELALPIVREAAREWVAYRRERGQPLTERAWKIALAKLEPFAGPEIVDAFRDSVVSNWQGIFPKRRNGFAKPAARINGERELPPENEW
jgi:hypothetical protein